MCQYDQKKKYPNTSNMLRGAQKRNRESVGAEAEMALEGGRAELVSRGFYME